MEFNNVSIGNLGPGVLRFENIDGTDWIVLREKVSLGTKAAEAASAGIETVAENPFETVAAAGVVVLKSVLGEITGQRPPRGGNEFAKDLSRSFKDNYHEPLGKELWKIKVKNITRMSSLPSENRVCCKTTRNAEYNIYFHDLLNKNYKTFFDEIARMNDMS